jgi:hypothetical protein
MFVVYTLKRGECDEIGTPFLRVSFLFFNGLCCLCVREHPRFSFPEEIRKKKLGHR